LGVVEDDLDSVRLGSTTTTTATIRPAGLQASRSEHTLPAYRWPGDSAVRGKKRNTRVVPIRVSSLRAAGLGYMNDCISPGE
jgi:hypothetical protein